MITRVFSNIDPSGVERTNALFRAWRETVLKVRVYGDRLAAHTRVVDLRHGVLTVEAGHPGWSQILLMNSGFIIRGLNMRLPELGIRSMSVRLAEGDAHCRAAVGREKTADVLSLPLAASDGGGGESAGCGSDGAANLPPEIMEKFENIRKIMGWEKDTREGSS